MALYLDLAKSKSDIIIDGTHENFKGTPLEGQDFKVVIGDDYDRTTYAQLARELMKDENGEHNPSLSDKAIFMLSVKEHDIIIGDEADFAKVLQIIYDDRKRLPQVLFSTIQEEINNYLTDAEKKSEDVETPSNDTELGLS